MTLNCQALFYENIKNAWESAEVNDTNHLTHRTYQASCQLDINTKCSRITFISLFKCSSVEH